MKLRIVKDDIFTNRDNKGSNSIPVQSMLVANHMPLKTLNNDLIRGSQSLFRSISKVKNRT